MKKMMKLFHDSRIIGDIKFPGVNGSDMLGLLTLTPEGDKLKDMFAFLTGKETRNLEPPYSDSLLKEGCSMVGDLKLTIAADKYLEMFAYIVGKKDLIID